MRRSEWYEMLGWDAGMLRVPREFCPFGPRDHELHRSVRRQRWAVKFRRWWLQGWEEARRRLEIQRMKPFDTPCQEPPLEHRPAKRGSYSVRDMNRFQVYQ